MSERSYCIAIVFTTRNVLQFNYTSEPFTGEGKKKNNLKSASQVHVSADEQFVTVTVDRQICVGSIRVRNCVFLVVFFFFALYHNVITQ